MTRLLQRSAFVSAFAVVLAGILSADARLMVAGAVVLVGIVLWMMPA